MDEWAIAKSRQLRIGTTETKNGHLPVQIRSGPGCKLSEGRNMDCGGCQNFLKWKNDKYGGGLCEIKDARTKSDYGHKCKLWKGIPYNRKKLKKVQINREFLL